MGLANILVNGYNAFASNNLIHCFHLLSGLGEDNTRPKKWGSLSLPLRIRKDLSPEYR